MYVKVSENNDDTIRDLYEVTDSLSSSECDDGNTVLTKVGTKWSRNKPSVMQRPTRNASVKKLTLTCHSENIRTPAEAFELFISNDILDVIIQKTKRRADALRGDEWQNRVCFSDYLVVCFNPYCDFAELVTYELGDTRKRQNGNENNTDEDSGEEDKVLNNLPGSQLLAEGEFLQDFGTYDYAEQKGKENEAIEEVNETKSGIWVCNNRNFSIYNPYIFGAEVTNPPQEIEEVPSTSHQNEDVENSELLEPTTPTTLEADSCNSPSVELLKSTLIRSPQEVRPYPKAAPQKQKAGRKPGKTRIVTDTVIEEEYKKRYKKNSNKKFDKIKQKVKPRIDATAQNLKLISQTNQALRKTICANHNSSDEENDYNDENIESDEDAACIYCNSLYSWSRACDLLLLGNSQLHPSPYPAYLYVEKSTDGCAGFIAFKLYMAQR
ncbi:hypothetical protein QE152_g21690 [Popillia japonica]|uniref:Uncharacterized protein n=1 Tax=Popillia japonica TaxID=7064 RepID=A0AAW1KNC0_POPJA